jgi:uncharacterized protein
MGYDLTAKRAVLFLIRVYQKMWSFHHNPSCRFWPSCSTYGYEVIEHFGLLKGLWLLIKRISRCHPWGSSGLDMPPINQHTE